MPRAIDLTDRTFGRLTALRDAGSEPGEGRLWRCRCSCSSESTVTAKNLLSGNTRSCGCLSRETAGARTRTHGATVAAGGKPTPEYCSWQSMKDRCENPRDSHYDAYGGRGIRVCEAWRHDFAAFLAHIGPRPSLAHSVDRFPNNDGHYEPGNVRWATPTQQARNMRRNVRVEAFGESLLIGEWSARTGIPAGTIKSRILRNVPAEEALTVRAFKTGPKPRRAA